MSYTGGLLYEQAYAIRVNRENDSLFYFFDYDERSYAINMEFQHFHSFYEIFLLLEDDAAHIVEGNYYPLKKYDMVFLKPARMHKSVYPQGKAKRRLIIDFAIPVSDTPLERSLSRILSIFDAQVPVMRFSENVQGQLFDIINDIFVQGKNPDPIRDLTIHTKFMEFLYRLYQESSHNIYAPGALPDTSNFRIYAVTAWIHENYRNSITLEQIAEQFNMSPYYLSHQFKQVTGFTLVNYIQMTRIRNVQQLLLYSNKKVTDIADECGFESFSQFNRTFRKFCDSSPSEFRKNTDSQYHMPIYQD